MATRGRPLSSGRPFRDPGRKKIIAHSKDRNTDNVGRLTIQKPICGQTKNGHPLRDGRLDQTPLDKRISYTKMRKNRNFMELVATSGASTHERKMFANPKATRISLRIKYELFIR